MSLIQVDARANALLLDHDAPIGSGGNSGFQGLNIAVRCGARRIVLVGYDLSSKAGVHWHGAHGAGLKNPTADSLREWAAIIDAQAPLLARIGVEVINTSPASALRAFPSATLEAALQ